eukprot:288000_1
MATFTSQTEWQCSKCTLIQSTKNTMCEICHNPNVLESVHTTDSNEFCSIDKCKALSRLSKLLQQYHKSPINDNETENIMLLLDDFNHLLFIHDNINEFQYIYDSLIKCDIKECVITKRHYKSRTVIVDDKEEKKQPSNDDNIVSIYTEMMDKIHCHFCHSFDLCCRLSSQERTMLLSEENTDKQNNNSKYTTICNFIKSKQKTLNILDVQFPNKFDNIPLQTESEYKCYSFGRAFYYWKPYQNLKKLVKQTRSMYRYNHWYITPYYASLKKELINNDLAKLTYKQWLNAYSKAQIYEQSRYGKMIVADTKYDKTPGNNTQLFGIPDDTPISASHLCSLVVYCAYSVLAFKLRETCRRLNKNEKDKDFKKRHSRFYHLSKNITEAVRVFSEERIETDSSIFYHGISQQMLFNSMECKMFQPFSTTTSWEVAVAFATTDGMVLGINCEPLERYFDCRWISDFSNEKESLFISSHAVLTITNIINIPQQIEFEPFVKAISIIDRCTQSLFTDDNNYMVRTNMLNKALESEEDLDVFNQPTVLYGGHEIHAVSKLLAIQLIKHELNITKIKDIHPYINKLFHNVCLYKTLITINWVSLCVEMTAKYSSGGYQGYLFLKDIFYDIESKMIRLNVILSLFPNTELIYFTNILDISKKSLEFILNFLSSSASKSLPLRFVFLFLDKKAMNTDQTNVLDILLFQKLFAEIGWIIEYHVDHQMIKFTTIQTYNNIMKKKATNNVGKINSQ